VAAHSVGYWRIETDFFGNYAAQAQRLLDGKAYTFLHNPPGYAGLVALASLLTGDLFAAGKMLSAFAATALVWVSCDLFRRLFTARLALAASVLLALMLLPYSYLASTDVVGALLMVLPLWLVLRAESHGARLWFSAGLLAGLAYLVRYNAVFVLATLLVAVFFALPLRQSGRRATLAVVALAVGFLLPVAPWLIANWRLNGSPFASTGHLQVAAHFFHPRGDAVGTSLTEMAPRFGSMTEVLLHDPVGLLKGYLRGLWVNTQWLFSRSLAFPAYLFAGAGILIYCVGIDRRRALLLLWGLLGFLLLALVGFYLRYYFFLFPLLALWAVLPFFGPELAGEQHDSADTALSRRSLIGIIGLTVVVGLVAIQTVREIRADLASAPHHVLEVAAELIHVASPDDIVISRKPHVPYYAGLPQIIPLAESVAEFRTAAEENGAKYLIYSDYEARLWPPLAAFADPDSVLQHGFRLLYRHASTNTMIYEIAPLPETTP
jgi:4-amino-4-deoxy-L-arabinose transferase-like glycosyltransferase